MSEDDELSRMFKDGLSEPGHHAEYREADWDAFEKMIDADELDKMFKAGLSEPSHHAEYSEADWDALEQMLDGRKKQRAIVAWLPYLSGVAALLLLFLGWMFLKPLTADKSKPVIAANKSISGNDTKTSNDTKNSVQTQPVNKQPQNNIAANTNTQNNTIEPQAANKQPQTNIADNNISTRPTKIEAQSTHLRQTNTNSQPGIGSRHSVNNTYAVSQHPRKGKTGIDNGNNQVISQPNQNPVLAMDHASGGNVSEDLYAVNSFIVEQPGMIKPQLTSADQLFKRPAQKTAAPAFHASRTHMAVTVLAASNANGVGSFQDSKAGADFGLMFSVGVKKLTLSTGAVYAKTLYGTDFSNYHPAYNFKTSPQYVDADCRILDIPLNLDYQLYSKAKNKFSVGAGLSSYLMLHENYDYDYGTGTYGPNGYSVTNKNQYYFGVFNLDVTYQRKLNQKLGLVLQPYLKLPLTNIGEGQVKLQTLGAAVGLSYNIK